MKSFKTCVKGLLLMMKPLRLQMPVSVLIGLLRIVSSLAFVWICKRLVDIATGQAISRGPEEIGEAVLVMAGIVAVQIISSIAGQWWTAYITVAAQNRMRFETFSHVLRSKWYGREIFHSGDMINRLEEDIRVVVDLICTRIPDVAVTLFQLLAASLYLFTMAPGLLWILLIIMPAAIIGSRMFFVTLRKLSNRVRELDSEVQKQMQENLQQRILILTLGAASKVIEKLGGTQQELKSTTVKRLNYNSVARAFLHIGFIGTYIAAFLWGIYGIKSGDVTYGMMTAFLQLVGQVQRPITEISRHIPAFIHSLTSIERLLELEELQEERNGSDNVFEGSCGVRISNISYSYPDGPCEVFKNFSFDFKPGSISAITGITGAGKTTLIKLILALLEPQEGRIEIYGNGKTAEVSPATRCNFMYVPQGNSLMSGTIRENLLLADHNAGEERMKAALHTAVADFVEELPKGLDTFCSEKGGGLSEGQAQRIAIARALLHKGGVLILDEASSALDLQTEGELLRRMEKAAEGRTIIWITHRDAITKIADNTLNI